jgi:hypothetical protein
VQQRFTFPGRNFSEVSVRNISDHDSEIESHSIRPLGHCLAISVSDDNDNGKL